VWWEVNCEKRGVRSHVYQAAPLALTSKWLWLQGYHQVKLLSSLNLSSGVPEENLINFGYDQDYNYGEEMIDALPETA